MPRASCWGAEGTRGVGVEGDTLFGACLKSSERRGIGVKGCLLCLLGEKEDAAPCTTRTTAVTIHDVGDGISLDPR